MPILPESAKEITLPKLASIRQRFPDQHITDIPIVIAEEFQKEAIRSSIEFTAT